MISRLFITLVITLCYMLLIDRHCNAQTPERQAEKRLALTSNGETSEMSYLLYLPPAYETNEEEWPLLLFLHGAGERGDDLELVKVHGPPKMIAQGEDFPFVVISPQCPDGEIWSIESLYALINEVVETHRIDTSRIYVTGLSMGGYGSWGLAYTYPDLFAAAVPICGGGEPEKAPLMKEIPTWVFHGAKDEAVPLQRSQEMVDALEEAGGNVRFTVYPEAGHVGAWVNAYGDPELWEWLVSQRRSR
ncbi:MAG: prolyl oligopeptidase family serine peptidase [Gemmatimonadetes bacterium]|nr:prolyl oligopeptidase family serine peptidase [Gemmatimonadota bacterium]